MIVKQDIYGFKDYKVIEIEYDDETMDVVWQSTKKNLSNHPYFTIENLSNRQVTENVWISDDNKLVPLKGVFPLFPSAKELINVLRQKRTSGNIVDYINYLKL
ncbi:MAG: hypothetical protein KJO69_06735 [Gammaproteobacteria bacterium]|nr:hypothetical protein [Gammaproteobacteria bacterium]